MNHFPAQASFELKAPSRKRLILRDDQISWTEAMDLARWLSSQKKTFVLIDTGLFSLAELEWLATRKAIIVSYPEAGRSWSEILLLGKVARRARRTVIFGYKGSETGERLAEIYPGLRIMGRGGIDIHLSGRARNLEPEALSQLAADCRQGQAYFVYYHYGPVEAWLHQLGKEEAWIHLLDHFFDWSQINNLEELFKSYARKVKLVIHLEKENGAAELVEMVSKWGGYLVFSRPPWPSFSVKKGYQADSALPFRAYHLEPRALF
jgi:hypothetical protein